MSDAFSTLNNRLLEAIHRQGFSLRINGDIIELCREEDAGRFRTEQLEKRLSILEKTTYSRLKQMKAELSELKKTVNDHLAPAPAPTAIQLIARERKRQIEVEGFDVKHDDRHSMGQLASAAACYAMGTRDIFTGTIGSVGTIDCPSPVWPFTPTWDKRAKHSRLKQLVIAGALIAAEIDRLYRGGHRIDDK
ncbi:hypothetical protein [Trichococcus shcherbakoviae]|uniref:hypothetical protein n=1 Tax=Trichococcus shcherbakoviae TaxID=2094020 RepID=UPI002AA630C8|nr:hypothetical protein [Trichococcus shcherbakoviae]